MLTRYLTKRPKPEPSARRPATATPCLVYGCRSTAIPGRTYCPKHIPKEFPR